jgi:geranylgeranyl reductase family protein
MDSCDVLIVGGGPAGSSCAWKLRGTRLNVAILDKAAFPRDKVCGGWITPAVLAELEIDPAEYATGRVLQPITGFRTSLMGNHEVQTSYGKPISYGIRRCEFDEYLLKRSGARLFENTPVTSLKRTGDFWIVNGCIRTRLLVGAGGHFCPVARFMGARMGNEAIVAAQEAEFELDPYEQRHCPIRAEVPELYFCPDMHGYGWCFRKGNILNIGLGRMDSHNLSKHVAEFLKYLKITGRFSSDLRTALHGHAYLLYGRDTRNVAGDGFLLIGDAAGLAYAQSGEGIRPAIESGLLAAQVIATAKGYKRRQLEPYRTLLSRRFGKSSRDWMTELGRRLPSHWLTSVARRLLANPWFTREVLLNRWFLHLSSSQRLPSVP